MTSIPDLVPTLQTLLTTTADQAGRDSGLIRRVRCFTGATFVQTLIFGWLANPDARRSPTASHPPPSPACARCSVPPSVR
jgi:hypothetical protein